MKGKKTMNAIISHRTRIWIRWVSIAAMLLSQVGPFTHNAIAQEPTVEPTALPTPTPAPTWTPTLAPVDPPTPTSPAPVGPTPTATGRVVDFRVDDDEIEPGTCVTFSWVVRGDLDRVEFDTMGDGKVAVLVPDMDSQTACPEEETEYQLIATWLDGAQTTRSIEIDFKSQSNGSSDGGTTATPIATGSWVAVTPIPIGTTPVPVAPSLSPATPTPNSSGVMMAMAAPTGRLNSVSMLPETGYGPPPPGDALQSAGHLTAAQSAVPTWLVFAGALILSCLISILGLLAATRFTRK
jgi:hypothetical protein